MSSFKRVCARRIPRKMINVDRQRPHLEEESDCTALDCDFELKRVGKNGLRLPCRDVVLLDRAIEVFCTCIVTQ